MKITLADHVFFRSRCVVVALGRLVHTRNMLLDDLQTMYGIRALLLSCVEKATGASKDAVRINPYKVAAEREREVDALKAENAELKKDKARLIEALKDCSIYADYYTRMDAELVLAQVERPIHQTLPEPASDMADRTRAIGDAQIRRTAGEMFGKTKG